MSLPTFSTDDAQYALVQNKIFQTFDKYSAVLAGNIDFDSISLGGTFSAEKFKKEDLKMLKAELKHMQLIFSDIKGQTASEYTYSERYFALMDEDKTDVLQAIMRIEAYATKLKIFLYYTTFLPPFRKTSLVKIINEFNTTIRKKYPVAPADDNKVAIQFTFFDGDNIQRENREITCPSYSSISNNYPTINEHLNYLINLDRPDDIGKFIFWYGPPGTGKSYMIRALAQTFKRKANIYYIVDPERFFHNAFYMQKIVTSKQRSIYNDYDDQPALDLIDEEVPIKLMIIEDGLNYIMMDSAHKEGGAISRLLNVTDGMLGDGLRLLFLVTSNEKVENIDPAFLRTGRCLQSLEFPQFSQDEATQWLTKNKEEHEQIILPNKSSYSLADLYGAINAYRNPVTQHKTSIGFKRG